MTSKLYDIFKFVALVLLPASSALYFGIAEIWGLPYAAQVVGTIAVLDTFLGLILKKSSSNFSKQSDLAPVVSTMKLYTDFDGVPTGRFALPDNAFDGVMFEDGKLVSLRVKRVIERR